MSIPAQFRASAPPPAPAPTPLAARAVLVLPAREAEPAIGEFQRRYTIAGKLGMPPHLTLLSPFDAPGGTSTTAIDAIRGALWGATPFTLVMQRPSQFGNDVLVLEPTNPAPVSDLHRRLADRLPDLVARTPQGRPHVSVAMAKQGADIAQLAAVVASRLPVTIAVKEAWLMERSANGSWTLRERFKLGE